MIRTKSLTILSPKNRQSIGHSLRFSACSHGCRYRSPDIDRAVRVYTVAQESRFLPTASLIP